MIQVKATVTSAVEVMPETYLCWLDAPAIVADARAGQFVMVRCGPDTYLPRPFSIHRVDGGRLALLFNTVGTGTRWLSQQKKGAMLDIFGPLGNGYTVPAESKNLLLVAGGIGIAPLCFLADTALSEGRKVTLIMGARSADYLLPVSSLPGLFNKGVLPASINVVNATDDGSEGFRGLATDLLPAYADSADQIFACGPVAMYRTMAAGYNTLYKKPVQLSLEIMMGCGSGVCYGCTIKTKSGLKQVCKDGPVFDITDIIWEEMKEV